MNKWNQLLNIIYSYFNKSIDFHLYSYHWSGRSPQSIKKFGHQQGLIWHPAKNNIKNEKFKTVRLIEICKKGR